MHTSINHCLSLALVKKMQRKLRKFEDSSMWNHQPTPLKHDLERKGEEKEEEDQEKT